MCYAKYRCGYAKSIPAKCKHCSKIIIKDELRLAIKEKVFIFLILKHIEIALILNCYFDFKG